MNYTDIAIFKHFIVERDLRRQFIRKYNKSIGVTRNPPSIEKYLSNTDPKNVIVNGLKAFFPNEAFGFDFWTHLNEVWQNYYENILADHSVNHEHGLATLSGFYAILRENWDAEKQHMFETVPQAMRRLGFDSVDEEQKEEPLIEFSPEQDDDLEIDFVEFEENRRVVNALVKGIMSVNLRNHSWRVTVNRTDTKYIKNKQVKYARIGKLKSGDVVIQFCNTKDERSISITYNADDYYNVNSRQFCENVKRMLSLSEDLFYLRMEKISENIDSITYKITKQE